MGLTEATVDSFKSTSGGTWDEDILADLFSSRDQILIKQTLLSINPPRDQWQWHHDLNGWYSMKSGYRQLIASHPSYSIYEANNGLKKLWSLSIPQE